jgi:sugar phosphate isomerase/epimerase
MTTARIGLQLYTLRDNLAADFEGTIRQVAALGYQGVEFAGYYDRSAADVRALLDELGLKTIGSHVSLVRLKEDLQGEIDYLKTIGGDVLICPYLQPSDYSDEQAWKDTFAHLQHAGEEARKQGLKFAYHNHAFEFETQVNGEFAFDALYNATKPEDVLVELDVCWVQFAGQDPLAYIRKYAGRLELLHLKDFTKDADGKLVTLELGLGDVALQSVIAEANQAGVSWLIVEQDHCQKPPLESITNSMAWLKSNGVI